MLGDIGFIVGVYAFVRLMALVTPIPEGLPGGWPGIVKISAWVGMGLIGLATLDIVSSSAAASAFIEGLTEGTTTR